MYRLVLALIVALVVCTGRAYMVQQQQRRTSSLRMSLVVFGGTGASGKEVVFQALKNNQKVVVLARDPAKMLIPAGSGGALADTPLKSDLLTVIQGDVTKQADVDRAYAAAKDEVTGVVVALGGRTKDVGKTMLSEGTNAIVSGMKRLTKAKRIAVITSIGAGNSENQAPLMFKALMYTVMKDIFADKNRQEAIFLNSAGAGADLEFTIVRPGGLGLGPPTGVINVIDGQAGSIMRSDVAQFCLGAVNEPSFPYLRQTPCISSVGGTAWVKSKGAGFDAPSTA